jgi:hypothetical protein
MTGFFIYRLVSWCRLSLLLDHDKIRSDKILPGLIIAEVIMIWSEVRQAYPEQWLIIEALAAQTKNNQRQLERIAVIESCPDGSTALQRYRQLRQQYPDREFYYVHTQREQLEIRERQWLGVRRSYAVNVG